MSASGALQKSLDVRCLSQSSVRDPKLTYLVIIFLGDAVLGGDGDSAKVSHTV